MKFYTVLGKVKDQRGFMFLFAKVIEHTSFQTVQMTALWPFLC